MAGEPHGRVALFSIHPRYAEAILEGTKQVEFRRQGLPEDVTHIVIYATAPTQRVVGVVEVAGVDRTTPRLAWSTYRDVGGIGKSDFDAYYSDAANAYVIHVRNPTSFESPVALTDIADDIRPPQSYMYLSGERLDRTLAYAEPGPKARKALAGAARRVLAFAGA